MAWSFGARKVIRLGPLFFNFASGGARGLVPRFTSWGVSIGRFRQNFTTRTTTVDTPGPGSIRRRRRRR